MKKINTIAEYMFRSWMNVHNLDEKSFQLKVFGNTGLISDRDGNTMELVYNPKTKEVIAE